MVLVQRADVGGLSYARLVRDQLVAPLRSGCGVIHDVYLTPWLRASVLADDVPGRVVLTGRAGWWVWTGRGTFDTLEAVAPRGTHVRPRVGERLPLQVRAILECPPATALAGVNVAPAWWCLADIFRSSTASGQQGKP